MCYSWLSHMVYTSIIFPSLYNLLLFVVLMTVVVLVLCTYVNSFLKSLGAWISSGHFQTHQLVCQFYFLGDFFLRALDTSVIWTDCPSVILRSPFFTLKSPLPSYHVGSPVSWKCVGETFALHSFWWSISSSSLLKINYWNLTYIFS